MLKPLAGWMGESLYTTKSISTLVIARIPSKYIGSFFLISAALIAQTSLTSIDTTKSLVESSLSNLPHLNAGVGPLDTEKTILKKPPAKNNSVNNIIKNPSNQPPISFQTSIFVEPSKPGSIKTPQGTLKYTKKLSVFATSYDSTCYGCSGTTALGLKAGYGVIAVDPQVIPLGSKVYVPGYGIAIAGDTGGAIKGNVIDLGFDSIKTGWWSSRQTDLYILKN